MKTKNIQYVSLSNDKERSKFISGKLRQLITPEDVILDAGCGKYNLFLKHHDVQELVGIDIDSSVFSVNKSISRGVVANIQSFEFAENTFDGITNINVIEHLERPDLFFKQGIKVLKPGGFLLLLAPNKHSLFGIIARSLPLTFKRQILSIFQAETENEKHYYRANTVKSLENTLLALGYSDISFYILNTLVSKERNKRLRMVFWPYYQLCRISFMRRFGGSLLCIARKKK